MSFASLPGSTSAAPPASDALGRFPTARNKNKKKCSARPPTRRSPARPTARARERAEHFCDDLEFGSHSLASLQPIKSGANPLLQLPIFSTCEPQSNLKTGGVKSLTWNNPQNPVIDLSQSQTSGYIRRTEIGRGPGRIAGGRPTEFTGGRGARVAGGSGGPARGAPEVSRSVGYRPRDPDAVPSPTDGTPA